MKKNDFIGFLGIFSLLFSFWLSSSGTAQTVQAVQAERAQTITLAWNPSVDPSVTGYRVYYGNVSGNYTNTVDAGLATRATLSSLSAGSPYFFVVRAYNAAGAVSLPTNEISTIAQRVQYGVSQITYLPSKKVQLTVTGPIGSTCSIYESSDLKKWKHFMTAVNATGNLVVVDPKTTSLSHRFYKSVDSSGESEPVGFLKLEMKGAQSYQVAGNSYLGLGFTHFISTRGQVTGFGNQTIVDSAAIWNDNQFNGPSGQYYVEIVSGAHAGLVSDILSTSALNKSLTTADDLSPYLVGGELFNVRRHRTLSDVFGSANQFGLYEGLNSEIADNVQVFNPVTQKYLTFYYQSAGPGGVGWRASSDPAADVSETQLYLDQGFIVTRKLSGNLPLIVTGAVHTGRTVIPVGSNYNLVANPYASGVLTLENSGLYQGDQNLGLAGGPSVVNADEVHIYNGNKSQVYFYKDGGQGGTGWRSSSHPNENAGSTEIPPGSSVFINRKEGREPFLWVVPQP